ncbi:MAG: GTPase HflX [Candidatus Cloacimonetes bacterium]|nr:GTPase HflX [Candidatus Cloacimonadota bacterium]
MLDIKKNKEKVFLVGVIYADEKREHYLESMEELKQLAITANTEIVDLYVQSLPRPNTATYIGKGKIAEIAARAKAEEVSTLVFNNNLSPSQSRNISDLTGCNVVDRTEIILDIFAKHARTKQAKLQVELAQLEYNYTKLKNLWKHLSRIQGGIGFRGPGETQIEIDRREIRKRTTFLKQKLIELDRVSETKRKNREDFISISLVGYTNAGKSTLFNKLTDEKRYVADQLFATLDSKTRSLKGYHEQDIVLTDTIGFIRRLPHRLVKSFHTTLTEVVEADLLLHVVDVSHSNLEELIAAVENVLVEIGADDLDTLMVFNKCDLQESKYFKFTKKRLLSTYRHCVFISAETGYGLDELDQKIAEFIDKKGKTTILKIPLQLPKLISYIHENAEVICEDIDEVNEVQIVEIKIDRQILDNIKKQIKKYEIEKYINN